MTHEIIGLGLAVSAVLIITGICVVYMIRNRALRAVLIDAGKTCDSLSNQLAVERAQKHDAIKRAEATTKLIENLRAMRVLPQVFIWDEIGDSEDFNDRWHPVYNGVAVAFSVEDARQKVARAYAAANPLNPTQEVAENKVYRRYAHAERFNIIRKGFMREPERVMYVAEFGAYAAEDEYKSTFFSVHDLPDSVTDKHPTRDQVEAAEYKRRKALQSPST